MSQLDMSISFSHLVSLLLCFYIFIHYVSFYFLIFLYNRKVREKLVQQEKLNLLKDNKIFLLKKIFES